MDDADPVPFRQIRAVYDDSTVTVYQAYGPQIADAALAAGRFVPPFSRTRSTWVKPSWYWMMYRSGWATKPGQERVLAVTMTRGGFDEALRGGCLTHVDPRVHPAYDDWAAALAASPVRLQWDPERDERLAPLPWRSLQIGLTPAVVGTFVDEWVVALADVTTLARGQALGHGTAPVERPYPLPPELARHIGATVA